MTEINQELINELRATMESCLQAAGQIPPAVFGSTRKEDRLNKEDYRAIGSSLFIEYNKQMKGNGNGGAPDEPISKKQLGLVGTLMSELGKEAQAIINQFLENVNKSEVKELTIEEASDMLTLLINANKERKAQRQARQKKK